MMENESRIKRLIEYTSTDRTVDVPSGR